MSLLSKIVGGFSVRGKATALYRRGIEKAGKRDLEGAIADYTSVLEMKRAPSDVISMALLNRALAYSRNNEDDKAQADLNRVLQMPDATPQVLNAAKEKVHRMKRRSARSEE